MTATKTAETLAEKLMDADNAIYDEMGIKQVSSFTAPEFAARAAAKAVAIIRSRNYSVETVLAACDVLDNENFHRMSRAVRFVIEENVPYDFI